MPEKMVYNSQRIMPLLKSNFSGWIQRTDPEHPDAVTSLWNQNL